LNLLITLRRFTVPAIYVALGVETYEVLQTLAAKERRRPHDQAAILIERGLDIAGAAQGDHDVEPGPPGSEADE